MNVRRMSVLAFMAAIALVAMVTRGQESLESRFPDVAFRQDVVYGTGGGENLVMDIAAPREGQGPFPAVVCIHGGGWRGGNKETFKGAAFALARRGYVAVSVQYRFAPKHAFPAQVNDVKCAVRYLRAHAKDLKIDPDRIGAMGGSAGGHLSLLLGTTTAEDGLEGDGGWAEFSSRVQAVGTLAGPTDLTQPFPDVVEVMLRDFLGGTREEKSKEYRVASPIHHLSREDAPIFAIHGTVDRLVPYAQATALMEACMQKEIPASLVTIEGGDHGSGGNIQDWLNANEQMFAFFDQHLKKKADAKP